MLQTIRRGLAAIALLAITACSTLSTEPARDMLDRVAYTQAGITAARDTAANMLARKRISVERAQGLLTQTDEAASTTLLARTAASSGDLSTAEGKVSAAVMLLTAITAPKKDAMEAANVALDLLVATQNAQKAGSVVSQLIIKAKTEGRPLNALDWASLDAADSAARQQLATEILAQGGKP